MRRLRSQAKSGSEAEIRHAHGQLAGLEWAREHLFELHKEETDGDEDEVRQVHE